MVETETGVLGRDSGRIAPGVRAPDAGCLGSQDSNGNISDHG